MAKVYDSVERRKFFRYPHEKSALCRKFFPCWDKVAVKKATSAVTKNLSASGILFTSKNRPELSDIISIELDLRGFPDYKAMTRRALILNNKLLGKVVRIEDKGNGEYDIGVAFLAKSEALAENIKSALAGNRRRGYAVYFFNILSGLAIVAATLFLNLIYLEQKEIYHCDRDMYTTPQSINISYENIDFKTEDGQTINGWFIPSAGAKATILYCPGSRGNLCDQLARIKFFNSMGINLFIFDYRGYGKSSGAPKEAGLYKDALAAYDYLISRKNDINIGKIVVLGESLGGAVAANLCLQRKVDALILESSIVSLYLKAKELYPLLPIKAILFEKYDTLSKIKKIRIPKLIVHGLDDEKIQFADALKLFYAAPEPKQFVPFRGSHNDDIFKISDSYRVQIYKFFHDNKLW